MDYAGFQRAQLSIIPTDPDNSDNYFLEEDNKETSKIEEIAPQFYLIKFETLKFQKNVPTSISDRKKNSNKPAVQFQFKFSLNVDNIEHTSSVFYLYARRDKVPELLQNQLRLSQGT